MAMGNRPEVKTASPPIVALDVTLLAQQLATALARVPFRHPLRGQSSPLSNLGMSVTREVTRSFMGYASSLRIPEFRSLELVVDEICQWIMPPVVRSLDVDGYPSVFGGVPGILYVPRAVRPVGVILYLHGGGYIGTSPTMYAFFTARVCRETECAVFVADYRLAPEFPFPAGAQDASAVYSEFVDRGVPRERIFLAGDSGGGGLANTLLLDNPARIKPVHPAGLVLFSPEVDLRLDEPSVTENADHDILPWNIPTASYLHGFDATERVGLPTHGGPQRIPPHLRDLGRLRDVSRPDPPLRPTPARRQCRDRGARVRGDVPRVSDAHAVGGGQPRRLPSRPPFHPRHRPRDPDSHHVDRDPSGHRLVTGPPGWPNRLTHRAETPPMRILAG